VTSRRRRHEGQTNRSCRSGHLLDGGSASAQFSDGAVKIGVLNDMSGPFMDIQGPGDVVSARMAIEDFGGSVRGGAIELVQGDLQDRPVMAIHGGPPSMLQASMYGAVMDHLKAAGGGTILTMGSFFDRLGVPQNLAYCASSCASKAAVAALARCLAVAWATDRIAVVNLAPGYIATDPSRDFLAEEKTQAWLRRRIPVGRAGTAGEVGRLAALLFDAETPFLTGETIHLDGGQGIKH
jgi:NAD(P)-dependent dehydrogenase (short-subunit alcohol dehydrogenase family)